MTDALPTTDPAASLVSRTVRDLLNDAIPVVEAAIIAAEPWAASPVLKQIWEEAFELIVGELGKALGTSAGFIVMDVQRFTAVTNAVNALTALKQAQAGGNADEITQANAAMDAAAAHLIHFAGQINR